MNEQLMEDEKSIIDSMKERLEAEIISSKSTSGFRDREKYIKPRTKRYLVRKENTSCFLLVLKQFALPYDYRTFKETEDFNESTKYRPSFSPDRAMKVQMSYFQENEDAFNRFKKVTGYSGNIADYNGTITPELYNAFKMFLEPQDIRLPALYINNEAITNRKGPQPYFYDFNEEEYYSLPYEEQLAKKPLWMKVQDLILLKIYKEVEELKKTKSYIEDTQDAQKNKVSAIFKTNPIQGLGLIHNYLAIRLDLDENGDFVDDLSEITPQQLVDKMIYFKPYAQSIKPIISNLREGTTKKDDIFTDFYPIRMDISTFQKDATGKPLQGEVQRKTSFRHANEFNFRVNEPGFVNLIKQVTNAIDLFYGNGKIEPEQATKGWFTISSYDSNFEDKLMSNLSKQYNPDSFRAVLSEDMVDRNRDALEVLFPEIDNIYDALDEMDDPTSNALPDITQTKKEAKALLEETVENTDFSNEGEQIIDLQEDMDFLG